MEKGKQLLIGCGLGCLALAVLAIGSCTAFTVWVNRPGDVLEPQRLLAAETEGYVEWTLRLEDPGTRECFDLLLTTLQEMGDQAPKFLPSSIEGPLRRLQNQRNEKKLRRIFPVVLVWTVEPGRDDGSDRHLLSASLRGMDHQLRFMDWILGWVLGFVEDSDVRSVNHRTERIYLLDLDDRPEPLPVFVHRGDFFMSTDEVQARDAIDRLLDDALPTRPELHPWLERLPTDSLRGAVSNHRGAVWRSWRDYLDPEIESRVEDETREALEGVTVQGSFTPEGSFEADLSFHFRRPEDARRAAGALAPALEELLQDAPLKLRRVTAEGRIVRCTLEITDIAESLPRPVERHDDSK